ncbi:MAG: class I SAM-dependent methyltransferase [Alphaproteobacteria bacterium]|nr:class I SAM-dependent methyltransferase [Alphaproteobacteria bacterium]MBU1516888.1 class I SAM-dependent methyltransferase [Alphaproteobacteria bacterium]MBU2092583.1 class I SAM-dependent methyltransferase [Alphaproteobacteria bacterium]MBU2151306.1 class I SAM-dependent methyltransferase [Alphaproteobacteria bacterium]MBU2309608.1 class I SAM-dependent methyltransferase [Alphaproteobacteria bacterium]
MNDRIAATMPPVPHVEVVGRVDGRCPGCGKTGDHTALRVPGDPGPDRELFAYGLCDACGTLFLDEPIDPSQFYGPNYYSHHAPPPASALKTKAMTARNIVTLFAPAAISRAMGRVSEHPTLPCLRPVIHGEVSRAFGRDARWIDIGCGHGALLKTLKAAGFRNLTGADPFMVAESHEPGLRLLRSDGISLSEQFDVVMMQSSLEHVLDPDAVLSGLHRILAPGGVVLIRIPIISSYAWRTYGGEWGNLDAPRHVTLWSQSGFEAAAARNGWKVARAACDGYMRGITSSEARLIGESEHFGKVNRLFTRSQLRTWKKLAADLNRSGQADELAFYLTA